MIKKVILTDEFQNSIILIMKRDLYLPKDFYEQILLKIENLNIFPNMYSKIQTNFYRKIPISNYIILYKIQENTIYIINIISTKSSYYNQLY